MFTQSFADAVAEAERLVAAAPFIETEADLLEGLQYLAGCIASCTHVAFDYDKDHPFLHSGTGPFEKMGLDNPDTMYFGTRVQPGHEYVVTGRRGTTTDVSFQLLGGEYTDANVPDSETAFDDRKLDIAEDGTFEWRFTPATPAQLARIETALQAREEIRDRLLSQHLDAMTPSPDLFVPPAPER